jgi:curved DNA-binding protein CbpA
MMNNYYDILGVSFSATFVEIKSKYRELSLQFHPDKIKTSLSDEMMKKINEAYNVLSNPEKRRQYDKASSFENSTKDENTKQVWKRQLKTIIVELMKILSQYSKNMSDTQKTQGKNKNHTGWKYSFQQDQDFANRMFGVGKHSNKKRNS